MVVEGVVDHYVALVRGHPGHERAARGYALSLHRDRIRKIDAFGREGVKVRGVGDAIDKAHAFGLHLVAFKNQNVGAVFHSGIIIPNRRAVQARPSNPHYGCCRLKAELQTPQNQAKTCL